MVLEGTTSSRIATVTADDLDELPQYKDASFSIIDWSPDADVPSEELCNSHCRHCSVVIHCSVKYEDSGI